VVPITVHNDDPNDLYVSIRDLNRAGSPVVLDNERFNKDESRGISIQEDGTGKGSISWEATRTDDATVTKTGAEKPSSNDIVDIDVFGV
jgi:hypothetical protein